MVASSPGTSEQLRTASPNSSLILMLPLTFESQVSRVTFCSLYAAAFLLALLFNSLIIVVVAADRQLHRPMYALIAGLSLTDIATSASALPRMVQNHAWSPYISVAECTAQMAVVHLAVRLQGFTLGIMSVDRYLAIGQPLRYHSLVSCRTAVGAFLAAAAAALLLVLINVVMVSGLDLCRARLISNPLCDFLSICSMACDGVEAHHRYGYATLALAIVLPACVVAVTYILILLECRKPGLRHGQRKALRTCATHLLVVVVYFTSILFTFVNGISIFASLARNARFIGQSIHVTLPPVVNPVIYGLCSTKIRSRLARLCRVKVAPGAPCER